MKKLIYLSLVVLLAGVADVANAQVQLAIGLKAGPNFGSLNTSSSIKDNYNNRTGFHGGAYVMFKFTKLAIQPEILFSQQGHSVKFNSQNINENYNYINVPVMIKLYLVGGLNLQAGPQFGFLSSAKGAVIDASSGNTTSQNIKGFMKTTDFSVGVGLGWDLPFGLNVSGRYNIGVSDINKYSGNQIPQSSYASFGTEQAKNQVFQFSVGYRLFKIGG